MLIAVVIFWRGPEERISGLNSSQKSSLSKMVSIYTEEGQAAKAQDNIDVYLSKIGDGDLGVYETYVGVAQQYKLLGEGIKAFEYYQKAVENNPDRSLAYLGVANLFLQTGLIEDADIYYQKAVEKEPQYIQNHLTYTDFLVRTFPTEKTKITNAFESAINHTGSDINALKAYASWLGDEKEYDKAIVLWKKVLEQNPENKESVQYEIDRLEKKKTL